MDIRYSLFLKQWSVFLCPKRFIAVVTGKRGGKTTLGAIWFINEILKDRTADYLIVAPTYKILSQAALPMFLRKVPPGLGKYKKMEQVFELNGGGIVFFRSLEDVRSIEGMNPAAVWGDELGMLGYDAWLALQGRVGSTLGRVLITTTPYSQNWLYYDFYLPWFKGIVKDYEYFKWRSVDNPHFPKEEYERMRREMGIARAGTFSMMYDAEFHRQAGLVYPVDKLDICDSFDIPGAWKKIAGYDWGYRDPTAIPFFAISPNGGWYLYREYYKSRVELKDYTNIIVDENPVRIYCDPSRPDKIAEMIDNYGIPAQSAENDKALGVDVITMLINSGKLHVFKNCENFINEIFNWKYREPTGRIGKVSREDTVDRDNHLLDAAKYAILSETTYYGGGDIDEEYLARQPIKPIRFVDAPLTIDEHLAIVSEWAKHSASGGTKSYSDFITEWREENAEPE